MNVNIQIICQHFNENATPYCFNDRWSLSQLLDREVSFDNPASFEEMYPLWVGPKGLKPVSQERLGEYNLYLRKFFHNQELELFYQRVQEMFPGEPTEESLSLYHTIVLIEWIIRGRRGSPFKIAEIGMGYGRIGEYIARYHGTSQYWAFDCIPESIFYTYKHLQKFNSVNLFLKSDNITNTLQSTEQSLNVAPGGLFGALPMSSMDIILNVASIQEMTNQAYHAYWLKIPEALSDGGHFIFINSRDFFYKREYYVPKKMQLVIKDQSPRSRTTDYPIEIYKKSDSNLDIWETQNLLTEYYSKLKERLLLEKQEQLSRQTKQIENFKKRILALQKGHKKRLETLNETHKRRLAPLNNQHTKKTPKRSLLLFFDHTKQRFKLARILRLLNRVKKRITSIFK